MKIATIISLFISVLVVILIAFYLSKTQSRTNTLWGLYGTNILQLAFFYLFVGLVFVFVSKKTRSSGIGLILGGFLTALIGESICSGLLRF